MQVSIRIGSTKWFRYLWLKKVVGFVTYEHCAKCLRGSYDKNFGLFTTSGKRVEVEYNEGDILYLCGVAKPYVYQNNFHLAGTVKAGAYSSVVMHNGHTLEVWGLEQIHFDDHAARTLFPERGEAFHSCRNFQFAAQHFGTGK